MACQLTEGCSQAFLPDQISNECSKAVQGETHDIEVVSLYALDKDAGCSLDAIGSSFPITFPCVHHECLHTHVYEHSVTAACNEVLPVLKEQTAHKEKCSSIRKTLKLTAALFTSRHRGNGICQFRRKTKYVPVRSVPVAMYAAISCSDSLLKWTAVVSANVCTSNFEVLP